MISTLMLITSGLFLFLAAFSFIIAASRNEGYGKTFILVLISVLFIIPSFMPRKFKQYLTGEEDEEEDEPTEASGIGRGAEVEGGPSASPTTTQAPEPSPEPSPEPADPIVLPEIHNGMTIVFVLAIVAILVIGGLITWKLVRNHRHTTRLERERREALEKDKAAALASWQKIIDRHAAVREKHLHAETDWDTLFLYPAINDASVPSTLRMLQAMRAASLVSDKPPASLGTDTDISALPYPKLVDKLEVAWDEAWSHARKVGQRSLPLKEKKLIGQIRQLLRTAENAGSSPTEVELAYKRISDLVAQLEVVRLPEKATQAIEQHQRLAIEAGSPAMQ